MNYQRIYDNIIKNAKLNNRKRSDEIYLENHHIIPKCLNGNNEKDNLVLLTAKEHYVCHKLLTYIYPKNRKIICAFHFMTYGKHINDKINLSARDYEHARQLMSTVPMSIESRKKISKSKKGNSIVGFT